MNQVEVRDMLLQLHHIVTGKNIPLEEIIREGMKADNESNDIRLIHNTGLSGKLALNKRVPIEKYYTLDDILGGVYGTDVKSVCN
ncbi:MAG: hypothetical protein LBD20_09480 [Spirochaetaceae bacterium]|jgi:hypothetical protein|nr:hypothetical protein [Spirochaetaceae bacterium]